MNHLACHAGKHTALIVALGLLILITLSPSVSAQLSFRTIGGDTTPTGLFYQIGKQDVPITVTQDVRSIPYNYKGGSPLVFYTLANGSDGKVIRTPVAEVDLTSAGTYPLFFFFKETSGPGKLRILTMKEDVSSFPASTFRLVNFSSLPAQILLGTNSFVVSPNAIVDHSSPGTSISLSVAALTSKGPVMVLTYVMPYEPKERYLLAICPSQGERYPLEVKNLPDSVPGVK